MHGEEMSFKINVKQGSPWTRIPSKKLDKFQGCTKLRSNEMSS
jgi:hypothetical protein